MVFTSRVMVSGVKRDCASWSVDRELSGDLPAQVAAVSGLVQASGTIEWVEVNDVDSMPTTPFNDSSGWLPRRGNRVEIYAGDGTSEWRVFTGLIDTSSGSVGGGFQSKIIDDRDKLNGPFRHEALLRVMPPLNRGAAAYRGAGLTYLYYVDAALRRSGFYATPPAEARQAVSVPAQSSMWPEVGNMTAGVVGGVTVDGSSWSSTYNSVDGVAVANVSNTYNPNVSLAYGSMYRTSMTVDPAHSGNASITSYFDGSNNIQLSVAGSRTVIARLNGVEVCRIVMGSAVRVSLVVEGNAWELRTNTGGIVTGTATAPTSATLDRVTVTADQASRVAGFHTCYPASSTRWDYTNFTPSARYRMDSTLLFGIMDAAPAIVDGTCFDLLDRISQATLSAMWIDELGAFNWAPSTTLTSIPTVKVITTADDILSMPWEDNLLGTRSKVIAKHQVPAISVSRWDNIVCYEGGADMLESGQTESEFISPPADMDWVGVDTSMTVLGTGSWSLYNLRCGTFGGGIFTSSGETTSEAGLTFTVTLDVIDVNTMKVTHKVGTLPTDVQFEPTTSPTDAALWERLRDKPLPVIRSFGKAQWADLEVTGSPAGPSWAPALEHDIGPWLSREQREDSIAVERVANRLAEQTATSLPTIGDMDVVFDPRLQLGDRIAIRSDKYVGAVFTAIITGISNGAGDSFTQSISVRITSLETTFQSYDAWNTQYPGVLTYDQWAVLSPMTYDQFALSKD